MTEENLKAKDYLRFAKQGCLTRPDLNKMIDMIQKSEPGTNDEDLFYLITALGKTDQSQYSSLVEKFLIYPKDPMVASAALNTLYRWDLTEKYLDEIKMFLKGVEWDDEEVRTAATSIAGTYLRSKFDKELLKLLLDLFHGIENTGIKYDELEEIRENMKECAYQGIALAMGKSWEEIFTESEFDPNVIKKAQELLEKQKT